MFVFDPEYTFEWPVKVEHPGGEEQQFTAIFRQPEELEIFERLKGEDVTTLITAARDRAARLLVGWRDIKTRNGDDFPFTEENRDRLLRNRDIRIAVDAALYDAIVGVREKN